MGAWTRALCALWAVGLADYGDLCRCSCDEAVIEDITMLMPTAAKCSFCTPEVCRHVFIKQCRGATRVSTECVDRTSTRYRLTVQIYYAALIALGLLIILSYVHPATVYKLRIKDAS